MRQPRCSGGGRGRRWLNGVVRGSGRVYGILEGLEGRKSGYPRNVAKRRAGFQSGDGRERRGIDKKARGGLSGMCVVDQGDEGREYGNDVVEKGSVAALMQQGKNGWRGLWRTRGCVCVVLWGCSVCAFVLQGRTAVRRGECGSAVVCLKAGASWRACVDARAGGKKVCCFVCRLLHQAPPITDGGRVIRERQWEYQRGGKGYVVCVKVGEE